MSLNKLHIIIFFLLISLVAFAQTEGKTKNLSAYGVQLGFAQERSKISSTEVASNVLFIINNSNKKMELTLDISSPAGWKLFSKATKKISIESKDTLYFPVRVRPAYNIEGNTNYILNVFISTEEYTIANSMWYIEVEKISAWNVYTPKKKFYLTEKKDSTSFTVLITNDGNSDEALQVRIKPDPELVLINNLGEKIINLPQPIYLRSGQDTLLNYSLKLITKKKNVNAQNSQQIDKKKYRISLNVVNEKTGKAKGSNRSWSGKMDFYKVENTLKVKETKYNSLPITAELNTYDLLNNNTYSSLSLYGNKIFKNNSTLNYYINSNFSQNQLNAESYLGNYRYLGYTHKYFGIEIGDIGANRSGSSLSGKGVKANITLYNNTIGGVYIRSPKFWEDYTNSGFGVFHSLNLRKINWNNYYQHSNNELSKVTSDFGTSSVNLRILGSMLTIGGGYSIEKHSWDTIVDVTGYGFNLGYNVSYKKFGLYLYGNYGSPSYIYQKGYINGGGRISYRANKKTNISLSSRYTDSRPIMYSKGEIISNQIYNTNTYNYINISYTNKTGFFSFTPQYLTTLNNYIDARTAGTTFNYRLRSKSAFKFYTSTFIGYSRFALNPELGDIFIANVRASFRYKKFNSSIRYYYGPNYQSEQIQYINNEINPQKIYANIYYDFWFLNDKAKLSINFNYNLNTINTRQQLNFRPELFIYTDNKFRFSVYTRYMLFGEGEYTRTFTSIHGGTEELIVPASMLSTFEVGAGIKYNINVPISLTKNHDVKIIAFRDMNGNNKMDINETGIGQMLIHLKLNDTITNDLNNQNQDNIYNAPEEYDLVTNGKGEVTYENIPMGDYVVTAMPLASMGGWFDGHKFYRTIDKNKTIYVPLSRGARVSGAILLERDKFGTNKKVALGNIRITAIKQGDGKTFTTLTNTDGRFTMFIPNGDYIVVVNEEAISRGFNFMQNDIPLSINKDFENYNVSFYLSENKRKLNIRGKRTRALPITRTNTSGGSTRRPTIAPDETDTTNNNIIEQKTQLEDPDYLPVVEPTEEGSVWLIQLFPNEEARKLITDFDTLIGISNIRCITGQSDGFLYITESFPKKKKAKKLLKAIKKKGYKEAQIVEMVFGNKVEDAPLEPATDTTKTEVEPVEEIKDAGLEKTFIKIDSEEDRAFYRVEIFTSPKKLKSEDFLSLIPDIKELNMVEQDGLFKYSLGKFDTFEEAKTYKSELTKTYTLPDAFVTQYKTAW